MADKVTAGTTVPEGVGPGKIFPPLDSQHVRAAAVLAGVGVRPALRAAQAFALPRVSAVIEERRDHIERDLDKAEKLKAETQLALSLYELALAEARTKASAIAKEMRDELAAEIDSERARVDAHSRRSSPRRKRALRRARPRPWPAWARSRPTRRAPSLAG